MANRYRTKQTQGLQGQFFVSSVAEPAESDFETFVTGAAEGEFSFFNAAGTRYAGSGTPGNAANIQPGDKFFAAQKIDGKIKRSQLLDASACTVSSKAYAAGTKHTVAIGTVPAPAVGDDLSVSVIETTPTQEPFPTWFYDHTAASTDAYAELKSICAKINDASNKANFDDGKLVVASISTATTGGSLGTTETLAVVNGSTTFTFSATMAAILAAGDYISVVSEDTNEALLGAQIFKVTNVNVAVVTVDRPWTGATDASIANAKLQDLATTPGNLSLQLQAININEHFTAAIPSTWDEGGAVVTATPFTKSSGTPAQVLDFESEGNIWEGYRTGNRAFGEEFGVPTSQVDAVTNNTYDIYTVKYTTSQKSIMAPLAEDKHVSFVNFAISEPGMKTYIGQVLGDI